MNAKDWWLYLSSWLAAFALACLIVGMERWLDARRKRRRMAAAEPASPTLMEDHFNIDNGRHFIILGVSTPQEAMNFPGLPPIGHKRTHNGSLQQCVRQVAHECADGSWRVNHVYANAISAERGKVLTVKHDGVILSAMMASSCRP